MTNVHGIQPTVPPKAIEPAGAIGPANNVAAPKEAADVIELSPVAQLAAKVRDIPDVRTELVDRVKAELAAGTYETPEKLEVALSRLMEEVFPEL